MDSRTNDHDLILLNNDMWVELNMIFEGILQNREQSELSPDLIKIIEELSQNATDTQHLLSSQIDFDLYLDGLHKLIESKQFKQEVDLLLVNTLNFMNNNLNPKMASRQKSNAINLSQDNSAPLFFDKRINAGLGLLFQNRKTEDEELERALALSLKIDPSNFVPLADAADDLELQQALFESMNSISNQQIEGEEVIKDSKQEESDSPTCGYRRS